MSTLLPAEKRSSGQLKGWLAVAGILIPAVFNYMTAHDASAENRVRQEAAYEAIAKTVEQLQETVHDLELDVARMQGQRAGLIIPARPEAEPHVPAKMRAPPSLDSAVLDYKAKR